jgi:hypothetical protein
VPANATELRNQWTNAWGLSQFATAATTLPVSTMRSQYGAGQVLLYTVEGISHGTPVDPGSAASQCGTTGTYYIAADVGLASMTRLRLRLPRRRPHPIPALLHRASNYAHTAARQEHQSLGNTYANRSNQAMGYGTGTIERVGNPHTSADRLELLCSRRRPMLTAPPRPLPLASPSTASPTGPDRSYDHRSGPNG